MKWWQKAVKKIAVAVLKFFSKNLMWLVATVTVIVIAKKIYAKIVDKVDKPTKFVIDPNDEHAILIYNDKDANWDKVKLPNKRKGKDVASAGRGESKNKVLVEIKHEKITDIFDDPSM